jgi:hypothetical protein
MNYKPKSVEHFFNFLFDLKKNDIIDYYYFCDCDDISLNYINHIKHNTNIIYSELSYDKSLNDIKNTNNSIIIHKLLFDSLDNYQRILDNKNSIFTNIIKCLSNKNIKHNIPLLFILETDNIDFNYMFQIWLKHIKPEHNINVLIISKYDIKLDSVNQSNIPYIYFYKLNNNIDRQINLLNILFYIRSKKLYTDWTIITKKIYILILIPLIILLKNGIIMKSYTIIIYLFLNQIK